MAVVEVSGLHKAFGSQAVLLGVDLSLEAGSFTAILGPSGSGKTTLLRILAGFERPDRGSVVIAGVTVDDASSHLPPEKRRIGYVSQEGSLFPHLSVEANVGFGLPRSQRKGPRVGELLDAVGLSGLGRRYPHQLSGGQQQRVALARALAVRPELVLLDEPFASLDAALRANVRSDVQAILRGAGATVVLVTHDQDEALSVADHVAVIRGGRIAQISAPQEIYTRPRDAELARFVGDANVVTGVTDGAHINTALGRLEAREPLPAGVPADVAVLIRPEQVEVHTAAGAPGVPAKVLSTSFHGHDAVVRLSPEGGQLPEMTARVLGTRQLVPGEMVSVTIRGAVVAWPKGR